MVEPTRVYMNGPIRVIQYDEDLWLAYDKEAQEYCKSVWLDRAAPLKDIQVVALQLVPDALFPMHGHEKPYIVWQQRIPRDAVPLKAIERIAGKTVAEWVKFARQDDCLDSMAPSDLREILGALDRAKSVLKC